MAARAISSGTISFGLVSIPFKLYTAASPEGVHFHQLHAKCGSRIKYQVYCPTCDSTIERSDIVKGFEYAKESYVRFEEDELKALEAERTHNLEIVEFVPVSTVDFVQVDKSYYLGPDKGGAKAYRLLAKAMQATERVAVGRQWTRGKGHIVLVRPYREGLILHQLFYAGEVRSFSDVPVADDVSFKPAEKAMAEQLIQQLSAESFDPSKYRDEFRDRVLEAVEQKVAGQEITIAPSQGGAQIIDLFDALKASLERPRAEGQVLKPPTKAKTARGKRGKSRAASSE